MVRSLALLGAASAAIHQLRYAIGYGDGSSAALAAHPHGYLGVAMPGVLTALLIAIATALMHAAGGRMRPGRDARLRTWRIHVHAFAAVWLGCSLALALIYGAQETLEGAGAVAGSGWIGLALSVPAGFLVALALRGADASDALRVRDALVFVAASAAAQLAAAGAALAARLVPLRLRARGPPAAFVV
jgi:hypothetical protein